MFWTSLQEQKYNSTSNKELYYSTLAVLNPSTSLKTPHTALVLFPLELFM